MSAKMRVAILGGKNDRLSSCPSECFHCSCLGLGSDCGSYGHEEADKKVSLGPDSSPTQHRTYPKVAADPNMYCPSVRIMPLGPGPKRIILVAPAM
jgi:hypothetical protein